MLRPVTQNTEIVKVSVSFQANCREVGEIDYKYFLYDKGVLVYFPPNHNFFYAVQAVCLETGFNRLELPLDFVIPYEHQCLVTPDSRVFLVGGRISSRFIADSYEVLLTTSDKGKIPLKNLSPMK